MFFSLRRRTLQAWYLNKYSSHFSHSIVIIKHSSYCSASYLFHPETCNIYKVISTYKTTLSPCFYMGVATRQSSASSCLLAALSFRFIYRCKLLSLIYVSYLSLPLSLRTAVWRVRFSIPSPWLPGRFLRPLWCCFTLSPLTQLLCVVAFRPLGNPALLAVWP